MVIIIIIVVVVVVIIFHSKRNTQHRPWTVSYLTSFESNIVSLTVFEIFDIKDIFP